METHEHQIVKLQCDNAILTEEVTYLRSEVNGFQAKINKLEDRSLESNLILHGIEEHSPDDMDARNEKCTKQSLALLIGTLKLNNCKLPMKWRLSAPGD